jgi:hypothetical protein
MNAPSVEARLERIIQQVRKDKVSDLEWEALGYAADDLQLGLGQPVSPNPPYEKITVMESDPYVTALRDLTQEIGRKNKGAALKNAEQALRIWQSRKAR